MQEAAKAKMQDQINLETLYSKNQLMPRLRRYFEIELNERLGIDLSLFFSTNDIPKDAGFTFLVQMALHRRCDLPTMVGLLRSKCTSSQDAADLILWCCELDLAHWNPAFSILIVDDMLQIPEDVQRELDLYQFPLPMVIEPREVKCNRDTGYVTQKGSVILKQNHHEDDVCLDHLNRMNAVKLCINKTTAQMIANKWRNLDRVKEGESREDFEKRKRAFEKYDRTAKEVMATLSEHGDHFHLTHRYDKRGRVYCQGYHVTYQGNAWNKAVIELADKELVE